MVDRIQINVPHYMQVDGQWTIALPGSILDVPDASKFAGSINGQTTATVLSPGEAAGTLASHGKPTPVRNVRTR